MGTFLAIAGTLTIVFLLLAVPAKVQSYPDGGRTVCRDDQRSSTTCSAALALVKGGQIFVKFDFVDTLNNADISLSVDISMANCDIYTTIFCRGELNAASMDGNVKSPLIVKRRLPIVCDDNSRGAILSNATTLKPQLDEEVEIDSRKHGKAACASTSTNDTSTCISSAIWDSVNSNALYTVEHDGVYNVDVKLSPELADFNDWKPLSISITLKNPYGYLDALDYPLMVFYAVILVGYVLLAVVWCLLLCCYRRDIARLQCLIAVVVLLTVLEVACFVAQRAIINKEGSPFKGCLPILLVTTEVFSALRSSFAKVLFIIAFSHYACRSKSLLVNVAVFGIANFITACVNGLVKAFFYVARNGMPTSVLSASLPQLVLDFIFFVWIVMAITKTRCILKLQQNWEALAHYSYQVYAFVFCVFVVFAFCALFFIKGFTEKCENVWIICLKESYWYIISTVLLVAIMVLWRPSAGARHHLYTPIQCDDEGNAVQKENKHDDWVKRVKVFSPGEGEVTPLEPSNEINEE